MEPVSILGLAMTVILVVERLFKYFVKNTKKSKCCGGAVEFEYRGSSNDLTA